MKVFKYFIMLYEYIIRLHEYIIMLIVHMMINPNSSKGLIYRAENMEKAGEKYDGEIRIRYLLYARCLRELALKNLTVSQNKQFIEKNLRQ